MNIDIKQYCFAKFFPLVGLIILATIIGGCSVSYSFGKSSDGFESTLDSASSSFQSSSESSASDEDVAAKHQNEVADYTSAFVRSNIAEDYHESFQKGLSVIAARNGIVDWEQQPLGYLGIGKGLKKAGLKGEEYETYKKKFASGNNRKMREIQRGYDVEGREDS